MYAEYINMITVGVCLCVGYILKHLIVTDKINRYIPLIVGCLGVIITVWMNKALTPQTILIGLISGLSSTGFYEAFKKWVGGGKNDN